MLTYPTEFVILQEKYFIDEVVISETNRIIKGPALEFGEFVRLIDIWMLIIDNPEKNWAEYFSDYHVDIFGGFSILLNIFMSRNSF